MNLYYILELFGGLAMFLIGMKRMNDGLQKVAGHRMKQILKTITDTPLKGIAAGTIVTSIIQSSSATTVMIVGLVNAGIITLSQSIGVIMGANIGTTVTAQLIAFKISKYAWFFIILGAISIFNRRKSIAENWGLIIFGFGLIFIGLNTMTDALKPLQNSPAAKEILVALSSNPLTGILTGTIFTILIQSSSASIGVVIALASNGLIPFEGALYLVYGDNIGTTITAWLAGIAAQKTTRRVCVVHSMFNIFGTIIFGVLTWLHFYPWLIDYLTPGIINEATIARHIANSHTFFNIFNTFISIPLIPFYEKIALKLIKGEGIEISRIGEPKFINRQLLQNPEMAIDQTIRELGEMLKLSEMAINSSIDGFLNKDYKQFERVEKLENAIDHMQKEITLFLIELSEHELSDDNFHKIPSLLHSVNDIERLGDHAINLNEIFQQMMRKNKTMKNPPFIEEIKNSHIKIMQMIKFVNNFLETSNLNDSYKVIELEGQINQNQQDLRDRAVEMIQSGQCDAHSGLNIIDFIDNIEKIGDHLKNIVKAASKNFIYRGVTKGRLETLSI